MSAIYSSLGPQVLKFIPKGLKLIDPPAQASFLGSSFLVFFLMIAPTIFAAPLLLQQNSRRPSWSISGISSGAFMAEQVAVSHSAVFSHIVGIAGAYYGCAGDHFHRQKERWGERGLLYVQPDQSRLVNALTQGHLHRFFLDNKTFWAPSYQNPFYQAVQTCLRGRRTREVGRHNGLRKNHLASRVIATP